MSKAGRPLKWPLVDFPSDYGKRWKTRVSIRQMKKAGASDLATAAMRNELDRLAEHVKQGAAKARQAKRK